MTRDYATNYRQRLRRILFDEGVEAVLALVPESVVKKRAICDDAQRYGSGRAKLLHNVSYQYIHQICGCKSNEDIKS